MHHQPKSLTYRHSKQEARRKILKKQNSFYWFPGDMIDTVFTDCFSVDDPSLNLLIEWACGARWVQAKIGAPTGGQ